MRPCRSPSLLTALPSPATPRCSPLTAPLARSPSPLPLAPHRPPPLTGRRPSPLASQPRAAQRPPWPSRPHPLALAQARWPRRAEWPVQLVGRVVGSRPAAPGRRCRAALATYGGRLLGSLVRRVLGSPGSRWLARRAGQPPAALHCRERGRPPQADLLLGASRDGGPLDPAARAPVQAASGGRPENGPGSYLCATSAPLAAHWPWVALRLPGPLLVMVRWPLALAGWRFGDDSPAGPRPLAAHWPWVALRRPAPPLVPVRWPPTDHGWRAATDHAQFS
ncbi:hypothetical protein SAMN04488561_0003 [Jiangella alba]|uniref:Uncharacterized protein n=1 Tax=Jiangella alba TaxID=561176 RepID=A0A1H5BRD7_9ACTN|nr:hypothetical protein SAMN04488561_0003 [Jiangella alba]